MKKMILEELSEEMEIEKVFDKIKENIKVCLTERRDIKIVNKEQKIIYYFNIKQFPKLLDNLNKENLEVISSHLTSYIFVQLYDRMNLSDDFYFKFA